MGEYLRLGEFGLVASVTPPLDQPLARDLHLQYRLKGLDLVAEASQVALVEARFEVGAERLAITNLVQAVLFALQNPAAGPAALPDWLPRVLGGLEITLATNGFQATLPEGAPLAIEGLNLDLALSGLPLAELLAVSLREKLDPLAALNLLGAQPVWLDINDIKVDLPAGGMQLQGQARTQVPATPQALPEGSLTANIELRNLDALARIMDEAVDPTERGNLAALVAFLRLVGIERPGAGGAQVLGFALEANSRGEVVVNGKDLTPLLKNSASPVGDVNR